MYVQVFQTHDADLMKAVQEAIKEKFFNCLFTLSALDGKPLKLNLEGTEDEREKVAFANAYSKQWLKDKQAQSEINQNSPAVPEKIAEK